MLEHERTKAGRVGEVIQGLALKTRHAPRSVCNHSSSMENEKMTAKKVITERIEMESYRGDNLFEKIKTAWLEVPVDCEADASIWNGYIVYDREETDAEFNLRIKKETEEAERQQRISEQKASSHLVRELGERLQLVNERWPTLENGASVSIRGSVPMPDGRIASVQINVTANEAVKSDD